MNVHLAESTAATPSATPVNVQDPPVANSNHFLVKIMTDYGVHFLNGVSGLKVVFLLIKNNSRDFLFTLSSGAYYNGGKTCTTYY